MGYPTSMKFLKGPRETIGVYIPSWLLSSSKSTKHFWKQFLSTLKENGRYIPVPLNLPRLTLRSASQVTSLLKRKHMKAIVCHDSHLFERNTQYSRNVALLEAQVRFINSSDAQRVGHDKIKTKRKLCENGIPVLDDVVAKSAKEVSEALSKNAWHVIKPHDSGAGAGVFLVKKEDKKIFVYVHGKWMEAFLDDQTKGNSTGVLLRYKSRFGTRKYLYKLVLVEPYFNDDNDGFASIRCTVIGDRVVESVKRINKKSVTSNVSSGGKASAVTLSKEQEMLAVKALHTIGADYAGVDLLVCGGVSVIGEINIGPFTTYGVYTHIDSGKLFAEYVTRVCDALPTM